MFLLHLCRYYNIKPVSEYPSKNWQTTLIFNQWRIVCSRETFFLVTTLEFLILMSGLKKLERLIFYFLCYWMQLLMEWSQNTEDKTYKWQQILVPFSGVSFTGPSYLLARTLGLSLHQQAGSIIRSSVKVFGNYCIIFVNYFFVILSFLDILISLQILP